jgi:hypothetical protein
MWSDEGMTEYGRRTRSMPPPPHVLWDDLVALKSEGTRAWVRLLYDEVVPTVLHGERPGLVVWSSLWSKRPDDVVVLELSPRSSETDLTFRLLSPGDPPDQALSGHIRKRMNELLHRDLRFTYGA